MGIEAVELDKLGEFIEHVRGEEDLLVVNHRDSPPAFVRDRDQTSWMDVTVAPRVLARNRKLESRHPIEMASDHQLLVT